MPATGNEATRLSQLKYWWDTTISAINASIGDKLDKPGTAATEGQVLSNNGTNNVWIDPPSSVTLATGKAGYSGVVSNGADELIVQNPVGKTSGVVMTVDDAYPTKPIGLKVYGNTRQNLWINKSGTSNGVTVTKNDDGSITLSGTNTADTSYVTTRTYTLKPSTEYTISINEVISDSSTPKTSVYIQPMKDGIPVTGDISRYVGYGNITKSSFVTPASFDFADLIIAVSDERTVSGTYRVMLNEGGTAEPWCPPGLNSVSDLECVFEDVGEPPNVTTIPIDLQGGELCSLPDGTRDVLNVVTGEVEKAIGYIASYGGEEVGENYAASALTETGEIAHGAQVVYELSEPQTIQLTPPELPALPSPNATAYASANVEAESEMEYVQFLNVVLSKLSSGEQRLYKGTT